MTDSNDDDVLYTQILLVEDQPQLAQGMLRWLTREGLSIDYANSYQGALDLISKEGARYEAAILDHELPDGDSLELISMLTNHEPTCSALVLTAHNRPELVKEYRGRGAFRFLSKPINGIQLIAHVHATMLDSHRWRNAASAPNEKMPEPPKVVVDMEAAADRLRYICNLTPTEREVAYWLLQGVRDAQLAQLLGRAERTAKRHVSEVLRKAGVPNRSSLWAVLRNDNVGVSGQGGKPDDGDDEPKGGDGDDEPSS